MNKIDEIKKALYKGKGIGGDGWVKRFVASRKLKRVCDICGCSFQKGDVYYIKRKVFDEFGEIFAFEDTLCPRCKYQSDQRKIRFKAFKTKCHHPLRNDVWSYIPGEAVMQPDHTECLVCGKWL